MSAATLPGPERVDVMLFMPEATFAELHGHATRFGVTDAAFFTACWQAARPRIATDQTNPHLLSSSSGAVYLSLLTSVRDDALAFALSVERSMSWAFLKAWALVRTEVQALQSPQQFAAWARALTP